MLNVANTRPIISDCAYADASVSVVEQGVGLIQKLVNGELTVLPSDGQDTSVFAGVAWTDLFAPSSMVAVEMYTVPATGTLVVNLANTPTANADVSVTKVSDGTVIAQGGGGTQYAISGKVLTFGASNAGLAVKVTYRYALSVDDARYLFGQGFATFAQASQQVRKIDFIRKGDVYITNYATGDNWAGFTSSNTIKVAANGIFTIAGGATGPTVRAVVIHAPTEDNPYLGLRLDTY